MQMKDLPRNQYERAFENWLIDNHIRYIAIDERKRAAFAACKIKSFDFLLYPRNGQVMITEVKGRKFTGTSLANLRGLECWVTADDVDGLSRWQKIFGPQHIAVFVFAYKVENIDVDFAGREVFDFDAYRFFFFAIKLCDYSCFMKRRSPKWQTVTLPADGFRRCAVQISELLL